MWIFELMTADSGLAVSYKWSAGFTQQGSKNQLSQVVNTGILETNRPTATVTRISKSIKSNLSLPNTLPLDGLSKHSPMDITLSDILITIRRYVGPVKDKGDLGSSWNANDIQRACVSRHKAQNPALCYPQSPPT